MRLIVLLFLCQSVSAVRHSLKYFYTGSSGVPNFPEFVTVGMVDEIPFTHYDSNTMREEPKQDWMKKVTEVNPQYWDSQSQVSQGSQQWFKVNIETAKERFNQTGGVHIVQYMYGCEWDDETGEIDGFRQYGFDGEDFLSYDLKTWSWVAARQQAFISKEKWNNDEAELAYRKQYLTTLCPDWLKKYLELGRNSLLRTDLPSVSFLQKTPSSPVSCHATGFYPARAALLWTKDGVELHEEVERGEILPNQDGTFQMSAELKLESVPPEDWTRYQCVFQLSGRKEDVVTTLKKDKILTNWGRTPRGDPEESQSNTSVIIGVAVGVLALALILIGLFVYRCYRAKQAPSPVQSKEVLEQLNPHP